MWCLCLLGNNKIRRLIMENMNTQKNRKEKKNSSCQCMDMNEKYARGFNDDFIYEDEELDIIEDETPKKKN